MSLFLEMLNRAVYAFDGYETFDGPDESYILLGVCIANLWYNINRQRFDQLRLAGEEAVHEAAFEDLEPRWQRAFIAGTKLPQKWQDTWEDRFPKILLDVESYNDHQAI